MLPKHSIIKCKSSGGIHQSRQYLVYGKICGGCWKQNHFHGVCRSIKHIITKLETGSNIANKLCTGSEGNFMLFNIFQILCPNTATEQLNKTRQKCRD